MPKKNHRTSIVSRDPQGREIIRNCEVALDKLGLDGDQAQQIIVRAAELQNGMEKLLRELLVSNKFADEEVKLIYNYSYRWSGYNPKSIAKQVNRFHELFPKLGSADEQIASQPLLEHAEGWFAIPRWKKIAPTYGKAVEKVVDLLDPIYYPRFYNNHKDQFGPQYLRQSIKKEKAFQKIGDEQKDHDILVIPAQFGLRHWGRSPRRACVVMDASEFGLGAFEIGIMLLTHPERLRPFNLWIDCAGDEFAGDSGWVKNLCFWFNFEQYGLQALGYDDARECHGSASGFFPPHNVRP